MSMSEESALREYIEQIFDKYDEQKTGTINIQQLCLFFNDIFQSIGVQLTISPSQATKAIQLVEPTFSGSANKEQAFRTFKSLISFSQNSNSNSSSMSSSTYSQPQTQYPMMQMMGYNPMMGQYYSPNNFGGNYNQMQFMGQFNQGSYPQWPYGNYPNYPR